ncbi:hypothetical protein HanPSC8_Chr17g0784111 [Helianthus annuus]|nr:hypothetical protein HanPSC8_Chr17g0784111 [Helianthus annuus]
MRFSTYNWSYIQRILKTWHGYIWVRRVCYSSPYKYHILLLIQCQRQNIDCNLHLLVFYTFPCISSFAFFLQNQ